MRFTKPSLAVVLSFLLGLTSASLSAQVKVAPTKPAASISGRVSIKDKGAAGIVVGLRRSDMPGPYEILPHAATDQDGNYKIQNVQPGSYEVIFVGGAYVSADPPNSRGRSVVVAEGENVEGIDLALVRGGVITGRVTDADNRPIIDQPVELFRADAFKPPANQQPRQPVFPINRTMTDDRGIYRFFAIPAGSYKVATGRSDEAFSGSIAIGRPAYKQVFHPNVSEQVKASTLEVSEGSEATDIDIALGRPTQTFSIAGKVVTAGNSEPVPNISFGIQRIAGSRAEFMNTLVTTNNQGAFVVEGLVPGTYQAFMMSEPNNELRMDSHSFNITDQDVADLTLSVTKGATISGVVVLESDDQKAFAQLLNMRIGGYVSRPNQPGVMGQSASSNINPDGSFRLAGLPAGVANLSLGTIVSFERVKGFTVSRIERDGVVQTKGIELKEGDQIENVRMSITYGNATLRGVVNIENGTLSNSAPYFIQVTKPGESGSRIPTGRPDARGHFLMEGIPAGTYDVSVFVPGSPQGSKPPKPIKQQVTLQDGVVTDVVLTVNLGSDQQ